MHGSAACVPTEHPDAHTPARPPALARTPTHTHAHRPHTHTPRHAPYAQQVRIYADGPSFKEYAAALPAPRHRTVDERVDDHGLARLERCQPLDDLWELAEHAGPRRLAFGRSTLADRVGAGGDRREQRA